MANFSLWNRETLESLAQDLLDQNTMLRKMLLKSDTELAKYKQLNQTKGDPACTETNQPSQA